MVASDTVNLAGWMVLSQSPSPGNCSDGHRTKQRLFYFPFSFNKEELIKAYIGLPEKPLAITCTATGSLLVYT